MTVEATFHVHDSFTLSSRTTCFAIGEIRGDGKIRMGQRPLFPPALPPVAAIEFILMADRNEKLVLGFDYTSVEHRQELTQVLVPGLAIEFGSP